MPGGSFENLANGNNQSNAIIYAYASDDPKKIAKVRLGKMSVTDIIVQPASEEFSSFTADIGDPATLDIRGVIHLPLGYSYGGVQYTMSNWDKLPASVLAKVCNPRNTGPRPDEAPFCPHFLAKNEPPTITNTDRWEGGGFWSD